MREKVTVKILNSYERICKEVHHEKNIIKRKQEEIGRCCYGCHIICSRSGQCSIML